MATLITPFTYFADPVKNRPVSNGFVYIGRDNTDPTDPDNQIPLTMVCPCDGTVEHIPVEQPFRTGNGGVPVVNGRPAHIDIPTDFFSILLQDKNGTEVYRSPSAGQFGPDLSRFLQISRNLSDLDDEAAARTNLGGVLTEDESDGKYLQVSNNLSDLDDEAAARTNLGGVLTEDESDGKYLQVSNNLSDLDDEAAARTNLGGVLTEDESDGKYLQVSNNLSDLDDEAAARTNLGGVLTEDESDGKYLQVSNNLSDLDDEAAARTNLGGVLTEDESDGKYLQVSNNLSDLDDEAAARTNLGGVLTEDESDGKYLQVSNNLSDLDDEAAARTNLNLGTSALYNAFTGYRDLAVVPVGLISQWNNEVQPPDDWVIAKGQSTSLMDQSIQNIFGTNLPDLRTESTNTESIIHTGPLVSDFFMPLRDNLNIISGSGQATFIRSTNGTYLDRFGTLRTAAINEARFERQGILIEGGSTNNVIWSHGDNRWHNWGTIGGSEITDFPAPDLSTTTRRRFSGTGASTLGTGPSDTDSLQLNTTYTASVWVYPIRSIIAGRIIILDSLTTFFTGKVISIIPNVWQRVQQTFTTDGVSRNYRPAFYASNVQDDTEYYIFGMQVESLPFASSYIPTEGGTVTRSPDHLQIPANGNLPDPSSNVSISCDFDIIGNHDSEPTNEQIIYRNARSGNNGSLITSLAKFRSSGIRNIYGQGTSSLQNSTSHAAIEPNTKTNVIFIVDDNEIRSFVNGSDKQVNTTVNRAQNWGTNIDIGYRSSNLSRYLYGHVKNFRIWNRAISDSELP